MDLGINIGYLKYRLMLLDREEPSLHGGLHYTMNGYIDGECMLRFNYPEGDPNLFLQQRIDDALRETADAPPGSIILPSDTVIRVSCEAIAYLSHLTPIEFLITAEGADNTDDNVMFALLGFKHFMTLNAVNHKCRVQHHFLRLDRERFRLMMDKLHRENPEMWRRFKLIELPELNPGYFS